MNKKHRKPLLDNYRPGFIAAALLLLTLVSHAQVPQKYPQWGAQFNRIIPDSLQGLPADTFRVAASYQSIPWIANKAGSIYLWDVTSHIWSTFSPGGNLQDVTGRGNSTTLNLSATGIVTVKPQFFPSPTGEGLHFTKNFSSGGIAQILSFGPSNELYPLKLSGSTTTINGGDGVTPGAVSITSNSGSVSISTATLSATLTALTTQDRIVGQFSGNNQLGYLTFDPADFSIVSGVLKNLGGKTIYAADGIVAGNRKVNMNLHSLTFDSAQLVRIKEGNVDTGGIYDFNKGIDFLHYNHFFSSNIKSSIVAGIELKYNDLAAGTTNSFAVKPTGLFGTFANQTGQDAIVGFVTSTGKMGRIKIGAGLDLTDSTLSLTSGPASGIVGAGAQYQLGFYNAAGTTISPLTLITGSRALVSNTNGLPIASLTTAAQLGLMSDLTDSVQKQFNLKANLNSPTFTGTVVLPAGQAVNGVTLQNAGSPSLFLNQAGNYIPPTLDIIATNGNATTQNISATGIITVKPQFFPSPSGEGLHFTKNTNSGGLAQILSFGPSNELYPLTLSASTTTINGGDALNPGVVTMSSNNGTVNITGANIYATIANQASQDALIGFVTSTHKLGRIKIGSGLTLTDSVLSATGGGSGTISPGAANRLTYYPTSSTTVDDLAAITASRALVSDANGLPVAATTTTTELNYVSGVTSAIQTQFTGKQAALSGTGFVKISGTTISYDASTYLTANQSISFAPTGDVTGSTSGATSLAPVLTLATVNSNVGSFTNANVTVNAKGLITAVSNGTGGGSGTDNINVGSLFRLVKPATQEIKTLSAAGPLAYDSATTNVINLSIANSAADGSTKGAASFAAADFNASSGNVTIDYTNGQLASHSVNGFMSAADKAKLDSNFFLKNIHTGSDSLLIPVNDSTVGIKGLKATGIITLTSSGTDITIGNILVPLSQMANMATASLIYRKTAGSGAPEVNTLATLKTDLALTGINSGDQTISLTGDATGSGTGSFALTFATVNSNTGIFGSSTSIPSFTVNAKGLITAASNNVVIAPAGTLSGTTLNATVVTSSLTAHGTITSGGLGTGAVIAGVTMTLGSDASYDMYYRNSSGVLTRLANGTTGQFIGANTGAAPTWQTPSGGGSPGGSDTYVQFNSSGSFAGSAQFTFTGQALQLASTNTTQSTTSSEFAIAANSLTTGNALYAASSTLTTGKLVNLQVSGTAAAAGQAVLNIGTAGANATSTITSSGLLVSNTHTGTSSRNIAAQFDASGGTTNYAIVAPTGSIHFGNFGSPGGKLVNIKASSTSAMFSLEGNSNILPASMQYTVPTVGTVSTGITSALEWQITAGADLTGTVLFRVTNGGNVGIGIAPTAYLTLKAGTTAASTAPLKFTTGSLQTTAEAGAVEFLTDKFYGTITTGATRKEFTLNDAALTAGKTPVATTNGRLTDGLTLASGIYTPTLGSGSNISSSSNFTGHWIRVGDEVDVTIYCNITPTATSTNTTAQISLPVASTFVSVENLRGGGTTTDATATARPAILISGNTSTNKADINFVATSTSSQAVILHFKYTVL